MPEGGSRIPGLQGLRALAMLGVLASGANAMAAPGAGLVGVVAVLTLSGYLITALLHGWRRRVDAGLADPGALLGAYLERRALRILPACYLLLAAIAVASWFLEIGHAEAMPVFMLFLTDLWIGLVWHEAPGAFAHLWTLAVQVQFYLLWGPLLLFTPAARHPAICIAALAASVSAAAVLLQAGAPAAAIYTCPLVQVGALAGGGLFALHGGALMRHPAAPRCAAGAAATAAALAIAPALGLSPPAWLAGPVAVAATGALVAALRHGSAPRLAGLLQSPLPAWLGTRSYGLYLYHLFALSWLPPALERLAPALAHRLAALPQAAVALALTVLLAEASWRWVERPVLARRRGPPKRSVTPVHLSRATR